MRFCLLMMPVLCFCLAGCAPAISNIDDYRAVQMAPSDFLPSAKQLKDGKPKIVVFPLSEKGNGMTRMSDLGTVIASAVESRLSDCAVEIVDRTSTARLQQEVLLAEINGKGTYNGPEVADFAISGDVDKASLAYLASGGRPGGPPPGGPGGRPPHAQAARLSRASVSGKIKIIQLPSLKVVKTIAFSGSAEGFEDARDRRPPQSSDSGLMAKAAANAINAARIELKNYFARKGYVLEKRTRGGRAIYKINLGSEDGLKTGDVCQIFSLNRTFNAITREEDSEERLLGEGIVSERMGSRYSWLIVEDGDMQAPVRLGDYVKARYGKDVLEDVQVPLPPIPLLLPLINNRPY